MKIMNLESIEFSRMAEEYSFAGNPIADFVIELFTIGLYADWIQGKIDDEGVIGEFDCDDLLKLNEDQSKMIIRFFDEGAFHLYPIDFKERMIELVKEEIDPSELNKGEILQNQLIDLINKIEIKEI